MLLLHIFFFSFLSCCLAEEDSALADKSLPKSEYITPLAGDIMELPSKENPASNLVNVEEILRELRECRQKNRSLNETIDNILEEMADMKEYIVRNEEKITQVQSSVALMSHELDGVEDDIAVVASTVEKNSDQISSLAGEVVSLTEDLSKVSSSVNSNSGQITCATEALVSLTEDVQTLTSSDQQQETLIEDNIRRLDTLSIRGRWCGYQDHWTADNSIISYDSMFFMDTNMNLTETPLDLNTGRCNRSCDVQ